MLRGAACVVLSLFWAGACAGAGINFYSLTHEAALGSQMALEVERQVKLSDDAQVDEYVNRLAQNLAKQAETPFPVTVKVIQSDEVNAFTLPGGHIFVNTGMLRVTASEAEMASLLAHEIGHVAARHLTRQATRSELLRSGLLPAAGLAGVPGVLAGELARLGLGLGNFHVSREFEGEADQLGVRYLLAAGYDPRAAVDLLERVEAAERRHSGKLARLYETHPPTVERIRKVEKAIARLRTAEVALAVNTSEYEEIRKRLACCNSH